MPVNTDHIVRGTSLGFSEIGLEQQIGADLPRAQAQEVDRAGNVAECVQPGA